jgi:hypothetical protein
MWPTLVGDTDGPVVASGAGGVPAATGLPSSLAASPAEDATDIPEPQGSANGLAPAVLPSLAAGGLLKASWAGTGRPDIE